MAGGAGASDSGLGRGERHMNEFDLAVIGGGPGGYTAAEAAAKEGLRVVLFEKDKLGGTCLNRGCIPTKVLLHAAETYRAVGGASELGISVEGASYDFQAMHARKDAVVGSLRDGIVKLMDAGKICVVEGSARIIWPGTIECGGREYRATDIIVATGSVPSVPPIPGRELEGVYTSDDLLEGEGRDFGSLAIIGGGVIGVELAGLYGALGCKVTILEALDHLLPPMDREIAQRLTAIFRKQGISSVCRATVTGIERGEDGLMTVSYMDKKGAACTVAAEGVLVATGRRANTQGLFAEGCACLPDIERGAVVGDELGRTGVPNLYVIGDAKARNIQLAHVAEAQAKNAVATIAGKPAPVDMSVVPSCVYTSPEIASVGITETEAKAAGRPVRCAKSLAGANGKCVIEGCSTGYIKLVADARTDQLLGAQMVYPRATDLVGELALAIKQGLTVQDVAGVIHPHPTFSEGIRAAAEGF